MPDAIDDELLPSASPPALSVADLLTTATDLIATDLQSLQKDQTAQNKTPDISRLKMVQLALQCLRTVQDIRLKLDKRNREGNSGASAGTSENLDSFYDNLRGRLADLRGELLAQESAAESADAD